MNSFDVFVKGFTVHKILAVHQPLHPCVHNPGDVCTSESPAPAD